MREFRPGVRLSALDVVVLIAGSIGAYAAWQQEWSIGFVIAFVVGHAFLFGNVFRIAGFRGFLWGVMLGSLAGSTLILQVPGWTATAVASLCLTVILIVLEMRKPSYHGILWKQVNPGLRDWWDSNVAADNDTKEPLQ